MQCFNDGDHKYLIERKQKKTQISVHNHTMAFLVLKQRSKN